MKADPLSDVLARMTPARHQAIEDWFAAYAVPALIWPGQEIASPALPGGEG